MNRLKKIFAALRELAAEPLPSKAIADAWKIVGPHCAADAPRELQLIGKVIAAVVAIAEDQEKAP